MKEYEDLLSPETRAFMAEHEAEEAIRGPKRIAAVKEWQPLLQLLTDSGVAQLISSKLNVEIPKIEIVPKEYTHYPPSSRLPRVDEVDVLAAISESYAESVFPYGSGWTVRVALWPQSDGEFDSALRLEAMRVVLGDRQTVNFKVDQNRNLRVSGVGETFNGPIDHLNKRGLQRVSTGINKALRRPEIGKVNIVALAGAA